jgi:CBS domain-containing protein
MPLLAGCTAAYLISAILMKNTIMTEKLSRRGVRVPAEYAADYLDQIMVGDYCSREVVAFDENDDLASIRARLWNGEAQTTHQGYPVLRGGRLGGVITRRDLLDPSKEGSTPVSALITRPPSVIYEDSTLREAADHMVHENVGRLPVVLREDPLHVVGIISRSDLLAAHGARLQQHVRKRGTDIRT